MSIKSQPSILSWRKIQIAKYLIENNEINKMFFIGERICFDKNFLRQIINNLNKYVKLFLTSGCPSCNRPFYNESPKGPFYNFPSIIFARERIAMLKEELEKILIECENV